MQLPTTVGQYRLLAEIGRGAMAEVYLGEWMSDRTVRVAVKAVHTHLLRQNPDLINGLLNEARICERINHANIIKVFDFIRDDDAFYLVMEFVDGITLDSLIRNAARKRRRIPLEAGIHLVARALDGLDAAHRLKDENGGPLNLVHRDLKPGNIMLGRNAEVKILDFGVAKAADNLGDATATGVAKGTPRYMSPEQITGEKLGPPSDIFSMASVLYKVVTGANLFTGDGVAVVMAKVMRAETKDCAKQLESMLHGLGGVLDRATRRDPKERFTSAAEMAQRLRLVAEGLPDARGEAVVLRDLVESYAPKEKSFLHRLQQRQARGQTGIGPMERLPALEKSKKSGGGARIENLAGAGASTSGNEPTVLEPAATSGSGAGPTGQQKPDPAPPAQPPAPIGPQKPPPAGGSGSSLFANPLILAVLGVLIGVGVPVGYTRLLRPPPTSALPPGHLPEDPAARVEGQPDQAVDLAAGMGQLEILTVRTDAIVYVNEMAVGRFPFDLVAGPHLVRVVAPGAGVQKSFEVEVTEDQRVARVVLFGGE